MCVYETRGKAKFSVDIHKKLCVSTENFALPLKEFLSKTLHQSEFLKKIFISDLILNIVEE